MQPESWTAWALAVNTKRPAAVAASCRRTPSVDAVRVALGNTGSKTTIHKYPKELEAEEGGATATRRQLSERLATSQSTTQQVEVMLAQVAGNERLIETLGEQLVQTAAQTEVLSTQAKTLESALIAAKITLASQQEIISDLRGRNPKFD